MGYFPMFLKNRTCVENTFKSAATTTAARFFKTISPEAGLNFLHYLPCSRLGRYWWPAVEILCWLEKTYKREWYLGETSVSLRLPQVLEPPWECKFSPGQYAPKPGEPHQGPGLVLGGGWSEEGRGGLHWCQHPEEEGEVHERQGWQGGIMCSVVGGRLRRRRELREGGGKKLWQDQVFKILLLVEEAKKTE